MNMMVTVDDAAVFGRMLNIFLKAIIFDVGRALYSAMHVLTTIFIFVLYPPSTNVTVLYHSCWLNH